MRNFWTQEQLDLLAKIYPDTPTKEVAERLGRSMRSVYAQAKLHNIKKNEAYLNSPASGRLRNGTHPNSVRNQFKKGQVSWNKGRKLGAAHIKGNMVNTLFKKGQLPHNTKYDGAEVIRNSKGRPYVWVRVSQGLWREKHRLVWEQANGPIPRGCNIQFKDGNSLNCALENLYMIDRRNQMLSNTIHRYPEEIVQTIKTLSRLKRKIKTYEKQD